MTERTPSISIEDALQLFLQLVNPAGLTDGPEKDALLEHMRARVAADRPEWAEASEVPLPPPPRDAQSDYAQSDYAQIKANIVTAAQAPEIPSDPMERALWNEHEQARQNAEQRRANAEEDAIRERLREQAIADKREVDEATLGRALRIRRLLELKLAALAPSTTEGEGLGQLGKLAPSSSSINASDLEFSPSGAESSEPERVSFSVEERVELMRAYNAERRALLRTREDVLGHREDADERMQMSTDDTRPPPRGKRTRTWDLQLD